MSPNLGEVDNLFAQNLPIFPEDDSRGGTPPLHPDEDDFVAFGDDDDDDDADSRGLTEAEREQHETILQYLCERLNETKTVHRQISAVVERLIDEEAQKSGIEPTLEWTSGIYDKVTRAVHSKEGRARLSASTPFFTSQTGTKPTRNSKGGPFLDNVPPRRKPQEIILPTLFAPAYRSIFTLTAPGHNILPLLSHVNCGYLSTSGVSPNLLQLKQHAQSLVILIKSLTVSTIPAIIDNANAGIQGANAFSDGETYDFLNDLQTPYTGPLNDAFKPHHNMPLTTLMNVLEQVPVQHSGSMTPKARLRDICPLHVAIKAPFNGPSLPYATHQTLISHANEVLELLDHEYSAKGGLLSILPPQDQKEDREKAEATLLGQLLLFMQRLVQRLHDMERLYANALDVIAGEAVVPHQALSRLGPDGRKGREMVYPQDRFVLVNAGEDLWQYLNTEFEKKGRTDEAVDENYRRMGVAGEKLWAQRGGKEFARGVTCLDVTTRYYRLRKDPLKTIFVIPAHANHPGTTITREMEKQPTVVSVVKPLWPERASTWEMKNRADLQELTVARRDLTTLKDHVERLSLEVSALQFDNELKTSSLRRCKDENTSLQAIIADPKGVAERASTLALITQAKADTAKAAADQQLLDQDKAHVAADRAAASRLRKELETQISAFRTRRDAELEKHHERMLERVRRADDVDKDNAAYGVQIEERLRGVWTAQIAQTQALVQYLKTKAVDVGEESVPVEVRAIASQTAEELVAQVLAGMPARA